MKSCTCWHDTNEKLLEKGYRLPISMESFRLIESKKTTTMKWCMSIPIQRIDGKKLKQSEPKTILANSLPILRNKIMNLCQPKTELKKIPIAMRKHLGKMGMVGGRSRSAAKVEASKRNFRNWHKKQGS